MRQNRLTIPPRESGEIVLRADQVKLIFGAHAQTRSLTRLLFTKRGEVFWKVRPNIVNQDKSHPEVVGKIEASVIGNDYEQSLKLQDTYHLAVQALAEAGIVVAAQSERAGLPFVEGEEESDVLPFQEKKVA